ncbi:MAG: amino acid permease [Nanoarchaeota archaeon]|nr:amino acid permease [Nanoarchaeota archaeon]
MQQLKKEIGFKTLILLTINSIVGTGIYFLPALGAHYAGPASLLSWAIMSVIAIFISLYFAELVSMFPKAGGTYEFVKQAFGEIPSFILGWMSWIIANITTSMLIVGAVYYLLPGAEFTTSLIVSLFFILFFNLINYSGIKQSSKMVLIFGVMTIAALLVIIIPGMFQIDINNFTPFFVFPNSTVFLAIFFIAETFFGWETITFLAEEVKDAQRTIPKALIISTIIISILAILLTTVCLGVINWETFSQEKAPLVAVASVLFGESFGKIFAFIIFIPIIGTAAGWIISSPRLLFAMARDKVFISDAKKIHKKRGTPHIAILFQTIITIVITLIAFGNYQYLLTLLVPLVLITYSVIMACVIKLRFSKPKVKRYFKAPFGIIGPLAVIIFNFYLIFLWITHEPSINILAFALGMIILGLPAYLIIKLQTDRNFIEKYFDQIGFIFDIYALRILVRTEHREKVVESADIDDDHIILDYGCGTGITTRMIAKKCYRVVAGDISEKQLKKAMKSGKKHNNIIYTKLTKASPFKIGMFDRVVSSIAINYFINPEKELEKINKSLKKNGKVSFLAIIAPTITTHPFLHHNRTIKTVFREAGFKDIKVDRDEWQFGEYIYITARK